MVDTAVFRLEVCGEHLTRDTVWQSSAFVDLLSHFSSSSTFGSFVPMSRQVPPPMGVSSIQSDYATTWGKVNIFVGGGVREMGCQLVEVIETGQIVGLTLWVR